LVETAQHILEELGGLGADLNDSGRKNRLEDSKIVDEPEANTSNEFIADDEYKHVLKCVDFEPTSVDKVVERSGLTADAVCSMLLVLELQGYVTALSGGYYCQGR
jgi:DNA processing protein